MFSFMHLADLHLGYEQYGLKQRAADIARAFRGQAQQAVKADVDFLLIAGDIFHSRNPHPSALFGMVEVLAILKQAGIPVVAVAGNHDRGWRSGGFDWLSFLGHLGYLHNLDVTVEQGTLILGPTGSEAPSIFETEEARVIGVPYLGAALPRLIDQLAQNLSGLPPKYNILLTHSGIEGEMPGFSQPLRHEHLEPLQPLVHYVALGHFHKPFQRENWIFNPGSLEALGVDESQYQGGAYLARVSKDENDTWQHEVSHIPSRRREFRRLALDISNYDSPGALAVGVERLVDKHSALAGKDPLIELTLTGSLQFSATSLDREQITEIIRRKLAPLKVLFRDLAVAPGISQVAHEDMPREVMEEALVKAAIQADSRYTPYAEHLAKLAIQIKEMALLGTDDEEVLNRVLEENTALFSEENQC